MVAVFKLRFVFLDVFIHNKCSYTEMKNIVGNICCNAPFLGRCYLLSICCKYPFLLEKLNKSVVEVDHLDVM